jgi:hypothetical protein
VILGALQNGSILLTLFWVWYINISLYAPDAFPLSCGAGAGV